MELLEEYLNLFKGKQPLAEDLERVRTSADKYRIPIPNPIPNPNPKERGASTKKSYGEHKNVRLTEEEYGKLKNLVGQIHLKNYIEKVSDYKESKGKAYKSDYAALRSWLRRDGLLKVDKKKEPQTEEEKTQTMYERAKKNARREIHQELIDVWRGLHKKFPNMGWDKLLEERGLKCT